MTKSIRYDGLDVLKAICAFLVVCIHTRRYTDASLDVEALCRLAVPVFFMITGFFYNGVVEQKRELKYIKKILWLIVWSNLLYFLYGFIVFDNCLGMVNYIASKVNLFNIKYFLLFNVSPFSDHLWYLNALIYVIFAFSFFLKKSKKIFLMILVLLLLSLGQVLGEFSEIIFGERLHYFFVRNFIFIGLPYFLIGYLISFYKASILDKMRNKYLIFILLFGITCVIERHLFGKNISVDHYTSTIFLSVTIFLYFISISEKEFIFKDKICKIGREYSTHIYILHMMFVNYLNLLSDKVKITGVYSYVIPIVVYFLTIILIWIWFKFIAFLKNMKRGIKNGLS